jgi:hypothetical protein
VKEKRKKEKRKREQNKKRERKNLDKYSRLGGRKEALGDQ